jgi:hypothetical protein
LAWPPLPSGLCANLIPIRRDRNLSDGRPHKKWTWNWLDSQLYAFGGATRATELYDGLSIDRDSGERVFDLSKK